MGGEWLHIALETDEIVLWSSDDIQSCFHMFSLPPAWRRWIGKVRTKEVPVYVGVGWVERSLFGQSDVLSCWFPLLAGLDPHMMATEG